MRKLTLHKRILALFIAVLILTAGMPLGHAATDVPGGIYDIYPGSTLFTLSGTSTNGNTEAIFAWYDETGTTLYMAIESTHQLDIMTIYMPAAKTADSYMSYGSNAPIIINSQSYLPHQKIPTNKTTFWTVFAFLNTTITGTSYPFDCRSTYVGGGHNIINGTLTVTPAPRMTISKSASPETYDTVGQSITYTYKITNTGNTTFTTLKLYDDKIPGGLAGIPVTLPAGGLAPLQFVEPTATYPITQADIDSGSVTNIAYAMSGSIRTIQDATATVYAIQGPALTIDKTASPAIYSEVGDVITYSYLITNTGNTTLTGLTLTDDKIPGDISVGSTTLAPDEWTTGIASYTIQQTDIDSGAVTNTATAAAFSGTLPVTATDSERVTANRTPALTIDKSADVSFYDAVGDVITYSYKITNTGNTNLTGLTVTDDILGIITVTPTSLAPGQTATGTASHTIDQPDIDAGSIYNTATATAYFGTESVTDWDDETVTAQQTRSMTIVKTASPATYDAVRQPINYSYLVTNTGNVTLYNVRVVDDKIDAAGEPVIAQLKPGATNAVTVTATYAITQADIDAGFVTNVAYATDGTTSSATDTETVNAIKKPALYITKTANPASVSTPQDVIYTYVIENTGNTTLYTITVTDDKINGGTPFNVTLSSEGLAPGLTATATATYPVTQAHIDAGTAIVNKATAVSGSTSSNEATATVTIVQNPKLTIDKSSDISEYTHTGTVITYTVRIENTGNQTLTGVTVNDTLYTGTDPSDFTESMTNDDILQVGEVWTYSYTYTTTQTDVDTGAKGLDIVNTVTVDTDKTNEQSDTVTVYGNATLAWSVTKVADKETYDREGIVIGYTVTIKNDGTQTVTGVTYSDSLAGISAISKSGDTVNPGNLDYGETWTLTYTYTTTQTDVDTDRRIDNTIKVISGMTEKTASDFVTANGTLTWTLIKIADESSYDRAGTKITYTVTITNTGTKTVTNLDLDDSLVDISGVKPVKSVDADNDLDVGETWTLTYSYTTTMQDLYSSRNIKNIITVDPANDTEKTDDVTVNVIPMVLLTITKTVSGGDDHDQSFLFTVTGEGISVNEAIQGSGSKTIRVPANGTYTVTEDTGWSWRYTADSAVKTITLSTSNGGVLFTNTLTHIYRLSDEAYTVNAFDPAPEPASVGTFTPVAALPPDEYSPKKKTAPAVGMV